MFTRWLNVKLIAAEKAMHEGRIDDAFNLACERSVRDHRRGKEIITELRTPLLARARLHIQAGRYADAIMDLDRLATLGHADRESDDLRQRAMNELRGRQDQRQQSREAYEKAASDIRAGRLDSGRIALDQLGGDPRRADLENELDVRMRRSEQLLDEARSALRDDDVVAALRFWEDAAQRHGRTADTDRFALEIAARWRSLLDDTFTKGQIDRFNGLLRAGQALLRVDPMLEEFSSRSALLALAAAQFARGELSELRATLTRLGGAARDARWISDALEAVGGMIAAREQLLASPIGLVAAPVENSPRIVTAERRAAGDNRNLPGNRPAAPGLDRGAGIDPLAAATVSAEPAATRSPLLLLVDGTGSCLLLRRDTVRIGRSGSEREIDMPIPADVQSHHADIVRHGEDYFLVAYAAAKVNGRAANKTLLRDGDRITLGSSAKMTFRKPSDRSGSAVLLMADRARLAQDVDRVVLFDDSIMIGPDASCHVRTREGDTRLVAFTRDGGLHVRLRPHNNGGHAHPAEPMPLNETRDWGDIRLTLKPYDPRWMPAG